MRYKERRQLAREAMQLTKVRTALRTRALEWAPRVAAATAVSKHGGWHSGQLTPPGETRASVHVESGHVTNDGRTAVRIVVNGAGVPQNWRQDRTFIVRAIAGGQ